MGEEEHAEAGPESSIVRAGDLLVGKYRVERVLGVGGMGVVVAANHEELEQRVAIKLMLPEMASNQEAVERFLREAKAAAKLRSEHVAKVLDVGKLENGSPYIVMEYLDGQDLDELLKKSGPIAVDRAAEYVLQACEAIAEAHAVGIVHRDLKPQNLFLTKRVHGAPLVKVLDFGISKVIKKTNMTLTKTGMVMGSPLYMSPEQLKGEKEVDHRADVWALGVILYQLLTARLPFDAETIPHLCALIMTEEPKTVREIRRELPEGIDAVVRRCLEKNKAKRFADVGALARALEKYAPASGRGTAERISMVLKQNDAMVAASPLAETASSPAMTDAIAAQSRTSVAWGEAPPVASKSDSKRTTFFVLGGLALVAAIGVTAYVAGRGSSTPGPSAPANTASSNAPATPSTTTPAATTTQLDGPAMTKPPTPAMDTNPTPPPASTTAVASTPPPPPATVKTPSKPTTTKPPSKPSSTASTTKPPVAKTTTPNPPDLFEDRK